MIEDFIYMSSRLMLMHIFCMKFSFTRLACSSDLHTLCNGMSPASCCVGIQHSFACTVGPAVMGLNLLLHRKNAIFSQICMQCFRLHGNILPDSRTLYRCALYCHCVLSIMHICITHLSMMDVSMKTYIHDTNVQFYGQDVLNIY